MNSSPPDPNQPNSPSSQPPPHPPTNPPSAQAPAFDLDLPQASSGSGAQPLYHETLPTNPPTSTVPNQAPSPDLSGNAPGYASTPPPIYPTGGQPHAAYNPAYGGQAPPSPQSPPYGTPPNYAAPGYEMPNYGAPYGVPPNAGTAAPPPPGSHTVETPGFYARTGSDEFSKLRDEFRSVRMSTVVPLSAWLKDKPWNLLWVRWFLVYAMAPLLLTRFIAEQTLGNAAWAFGVYFALLWLAVLHVAMRPGKLESGLLAQIAAFTAVVGVIIVLNIQRFPVFAQLYSSAANGGFVTRLIGFVFGVGIVEEGVKALPVYFLAARRRPDATPQMLAFAGVVSGLAFGVAEAVSYSYLYAQGLAQGAIGFGSYIVVQLVRLITLPLIHACWSAITGYFMGLGLLSPRSRRALILLGIGIAAALHGSYDTFASSWIGLLLAALSILVFISYVRTADIISKELMEQQTPVTPEGDVVFTPGTV